MELKAPKRTGVVLIPLAMRAEGATAAMDGWGAVRAADPEENPPREEGAGESATPRALFETLLRGPVEEAASAPAAADDDDEAAGADTEVASLPSDLEGLLRGSRPNICLIIVGKVDLCSRTNYPSFSAAPRLQKQVLRGGNAKLIKAEKDLS